MSALKHALFASDKANKRLCLRLRIADSVAVHLVINLVILPFWKVLVNVFSILYLEANLRSVSNPFIPDAVKLLNPPKWFLFDGFIDTRILHKELLEREL